MDEKPADPANSDFRFEEAIIFACAVVQRDRLHLTLGDLARARSVAARDLLTAEMQTLTTLIEFSSLRELYCRRRPLGAT